MYMYHSPSSLNNYSYHNLGSLVPPWLNKSKNVPLSLENLCANTIVRCENKCPLLSNTPLPTLLQKVLWRTYLTYEYYKYVDKLHEYFSRKLKKAQCEEPELSLDGLPELLYHWPIEEFTLRDVMPTLPSRFEPYHSIRIWDTEFDGYEFGPCEMNSRYLYMFYRGVVNTIVQTFSINYNESSVEQHKQFWQVRLMLVDSIHCLCNI